VRDRQRRGTRNGRRVLRLRSVLPDPLPYVFHGCPAPAQSSPGAGGHQTLRQVAHGRDTDSGPPRARTPAPARHTTRRPAARAPAPAVHRPEAESLLDDRGRAQTTGQPPASRSPRTARSRTARRQPQRRESGRGHDRIVKDFLQNTSDEPEWWAGPRVKRGSQPHGPSSATPLQESTDPRTLHSFTFKTKTPARTHAFISQSSHRTTPGVWSAAGLATGSVDRIHRTAVCP
jgi:hypothetical protein